VADGVRSGDLVDDGQVAAVVRLLDDAADDRFVLLG
jgi:hypothetical protein